MITYPQPCNVVTYRVMNYDGLVLAAAVAELKRTVEGGRIQHVRQHNDTDITLEIRSKEHSYLLFMSVNARFPRVYLTASSAPVPQTAPNFCMLLRKYIKGSFVTAVEQAGFDRVLKIRTEAPDGNRNVLVLELMGKHSNLALLSDSGRILGAAKYVTSAVSRYRQILPGLDYVPPPTGGKANPMEVTREEFEALLRDGLGQESSPDLVKRWLVAAFSGIGPFLAEEIMLRIDEPNPDTIWAALLELRRIVLTHDYSPRLITDDRGVTVFAYPIPTLQYTAANLHERRSMNETLDTLFRSLISRDEFDSEYAGLETNIRRAIASREQTLRQLQDTIADGEKSERYKQFGELVMASAGTIEKGQKCARLVDYYDPEMPEIDVPLDEKLTPKENAERYFRRYRKAREGAQTAEGRMTDIRTDVDFLRVELERLPAVNSVEELRGLRGMLTEKGLLRSEPRPSVPGKREEPEFPGFKIRRVTSSAGFEILYGENSQSNDYLTTKVARPNDYWLHARSVTGAHVVVRTANRPEAVPPATIREAAEIAARNSDAKHSSLVPVDYTLRKYVRKPRTAPHGLVTYQREKTIDVSPRER